MDAGTGRQDSLVSNLIGLIFEYRTEALTETRLAVLVCYSVTHIRRVFFAVMGESLGDFMLRVRLERAAGQLSVGNQSISSIALTANNQSGEAFASAFRARFQNPPTRFRVLNQGEAHLLPGYIYATDPTKASAPMEVGLYTNIGTIATYIYDGLALVGQIRPDSTAEIPEHSCSAEGIDRPGGTKHG